MMYELLAGEGLQEAKRYYFVRGITSIRSLILKTSASKAYWRLGTATGCISSTSTQLVGYFPV